MVNQELYEKWGKDYGPGQVIFREGEDGEIMYIIQEGTVEILKKSGNIEWVVALLGRGDFFGEMALVSRIKRTATARAVDQVKLLAFDRAGFQQMIEKSSRMAMAIIDKLCRRLEFTTQQLVQLGQANTQTAIAVYLKSLKAAGAVKPEWDLDQVLGDLSQALQQPRERILAQLKEMADRCIIVLTDKVVVLGPEAVLNDFIQSGGGACVES